MPLFFNAEWAWVHTDLACAFQIHYLETLSSGCFYGDNNKNSGKRICVSIWPKLARVYFICTTCVLPSWDEKYNLTNKSHESTWLFYGKKPNDSKAWIRLHALKLRTIKKVNIPLDSSELEYQFPIAMYLIIPITWIMNPRTIETRKLKIPAVASSTFPRHNILNISKSHETAIHVLKARKVRWSTVLDRSKIMKCFGREMNKRLLFLKRIYYVW